MISHLIRRSEHDTYLAYPQQKPEQRVVLKVFDAERIVPETTLSDFRQMETRLQGLKHPHIVAVLELGIEQGKPYLVTDYQPGGSLRQYLEQRASEHLSLEEAVGVVMQIGQAAAFAHAQGVVHQDIRPENVLLDAAGQVLLTDFGMESIIQPSENRSEQRVTSYQAPEQIIGTASPASDQYALGCLLYELLTGILPDPPVLRQQATLTALVAPTMLPTLPRQVEAVLLRTLAMKPRERYPDVTTFLAELKSAAQPEPPAFPFAHLTAGYQQTAASDLSKEFPSLLPTAPFISQAPQDKSLSAAFSAPPSLDAFLTIPEWDGASLLDRLAVADGQEEALLLSGITEISTSSKEPLPLHQVQEQNGNEINPLTEMALANFLDEDLHTQLWDQDTSVSQEKLPVAGAEEEVFPNLSSVSEKGPVEGKALPENVPGKAQIAAENIQSGLNNTFVKEQHKLVVIAWSNWKRPIILLGMALLLTFISILLMYSFNTRAITVVGSGPLSQASMTIAIPTQTRSTLSSTRTVHVQPTQIPPASTYATPFPTPASKAPLTPAPTPASKAPLTPTPTSKSNGVAPLGKTIWLQAVINGNYVSTRIDHTDGRLEAKSASVSTWEKFDVVDAGSGYIMLRARANSNYVCAQLNQANSPLQANSGVLQGCAEFLWIDKGNGKIALQVVTSASYVSARIDLANTPLSAQDTNIQGEELFLWGITS